MTSDILAVGTISPEAWAAVTDVVKDLAKAFNATGKTSMPMGRGSTPGQHCDLMARGYGQPTVRCHVDRHDSQRDNRI